MTRYKTRMYVLEITKPGGGWLKINDIRRNDVEQWIELLNYTECEWTLTCQVQEEQADV